MTLTQFAESVNIKLPFIAVTPLMATVTIPIGILLALLACTLYCKTLDPVKINDQNVFINVERAKFFYSS